MSVLHHYSPLVKRYTSKPEIEKKRKYDCEHCSSCKRIHNATPEVERIANQIDNEHEDSAQDNQLNPSILWWYLHRPPPPNLKPPSSEGEAECLY
jgi:hypothetical protein